MSETTQAGALSGEPEGMIEFNDQLLAIWFLPIDEKRDWMAGVSRVDAGRFRFVYRIRYYNPKSVNPHDGMDRRSEYSATIDGVDEAMAMEKLRTIARLLTEHAEGPLYELIRGARTVDEFAEELMRQPWAHPARHI